jgi:thioredoxin
MVRKIILLFCTAAVALSAFAQNRYEEILRFEMRGGRIVLPVTVQGTSRELVLDLTRPASALLAEVADSMGLQAVEGKVTLEKVAIGENLFIPSLPVTVVDDGVLAQLGVAGILGRDAFRESVLTIDRPEGYLTLSAPYKPAYMSLRNRADLTAEGDPTVAIGGQNVTAPLDSLLALGVVTFDFPRAKTYFESHETLVKPENPTSISGQGNVADGAVVHLDREAFLREVFDFRQNSEWKYQGDLPCVIDFWASWCGPCLKLNPIIKELAEQYKGRVQFYKVNVDEEKEISVGYFNIMAIPLLVFVPKEGEPQRVLAASKEEIEAKIKELLGE